MYVFLNPVETITRSTNTYFDFDVNVNLETLLSIFDFLREARLMYLCYS